jgi:hypothetical protein
VKQEKEKQLARLHILPRKEALRTKEWTCNILNSIIIAGRVP